jgi:hypothetical protein
VAIGLVGSDKFDQKNLSGHGLGLGRFGLSRVGFQVEHYRVFLGLRSFQVGPGRVSGCYELRSFWASSHSGPDQVGFQVI